MNKISNVRTQNVYGKTIQYTVMLFSTKEMSHLMGGRTMMEPSPLSLITHPHTLTTLTLDSRHPLLSLTSIARHRHRVLQQARQHDSDDEGGVGRERWKGGIGIGGGGRPARCRPMRRLIRGPRSSTRRDGAPPSCLSHRGRPPP